jgi:hypothetical protein
MHQLRLNGRERTYMQWTPCLLFIWNDNMREKREDNANATWRELIRDRPRGDGV